MKRLLLIGAIIAIAASCQKNDLIEDSFSDNRVKEVIFSAGIDSDEQTKAFILDWNIYWSDGDMLGGWSSQTQTDKTIFYRFDEQSLETGERGTTADFSGTVEYDVTQLRLFYPYDINADVIDGDNKYAMDLTSQKVDMYDAAVGYLSAQHIYMSSDVLAVDNEGNITDEQYTLYQVGSIVNLQLTLTGLPADEPYYLRQVTLGNFYAKGNYDFTQLRDDNADITDEEYATITVEVDNSRTISADQVMSVPVYILPTDLPEDYIFTIGVECSNSDGTKEYKGTLEHTQTTAASCERGKYYGAPRTVALKEVEKVTTTTEAQSAFEGGADDVVITEQISETGTIEIKSDADSSDAKSLTFDEGIANGQTVTITITDGNTSTLNITTPADNEGSIVVNATSTTVTINGKIVDGDVATAVDTFIVEKGAEVTGTLTVSAGNVEIYGQVNAVTFAEGNNDSYIKVWTVYNEDQFKAAIESERVNKIVLANDIEISETMTIANAMTIDGGDNSLSMSGSNYYFECNENLSLSNITIEHTPLYVIYVPEASNATEFNIKSSDLSGFAAIYTHGDGATYNIEDSVLTGTNAGDSYFATIYASDKAVGNTFNIESTTINTETKGDTYQYAINICETTGATEVNLTDGTNFDYKYNGNNSESRYYLIEHRVNNSERSTFTRDASITWSTDMTTKDLSLTSGLLFGDGSAETPYELYDSFDLQLVKFYTDREYTSYNQTFSEGTFAHFKQMNDIDYVYINSLMTPYPSPFVTISGSSVSAEPSPTSNLLADDFYGVYDGQGYSINNFGYNQDIVGNNWGTNLDVGLFAWVYPGSTIKNLTLTYDAENGGGGISVTSECQTSATLNGVGAFAGSLGGTIENCINYIPITVYSTKDDCRVGGIYGKPLYSGIYDGNFVNTYIDNCTNHANITVTGTASAGGIIGGGYNCWYPSIVVITNCTMNGNVTAPYAFGIYVEPEAQDYGYKQTYFVFEEEGEENECNGTVTSTGETVIE